MTDVFHGNGREWKVAEAGCGGICSWEHHALSSYRASQPVLGATMGQVSIFLKFLPQNGSAIPSRKRKFRKQIASSTSANPLPLQSMRR